MFGGAVPAAAVGRPSLGGLEDLLLHRGGQQAPDAEPTGPAVAAEVTAARREFQACRYDALARALPYRIALARALGDLGRPGQAATALAELYNLATRLCIKLGEDGLCVATADRALTAALAGGNPLIAAESRRMVSSAWRRQGHFARATDAAVDAADRLGADRTTPESERRAAQGGLYATAAYTAAKRGDRDGARELIAEAEALAQRLGDGPRARTSAFGPAQVVLHHISICHLLGDAGQAVERARSVHVAHLPTTERRARYWIDVARAYDQWRKPGDCFRALLAAERAAPQEVRRTSVRALTADLMRHDRALPGVRDFADRVGALA